MASAHVYPARLNGCFNWGFFGYRTPINSRGDFKSSRLFAHRIVSFTQHGYNVHVFLSIQKWIFYALFTIRYYFYKPAYKLIITNLDYNTWLSRNYRIIFPSQPPPYTNTTFEFKTKTQPKRKMDNMTRATIEFLSFFSSFSSYCY